jgi:hypothetical protein
MLPRFSPFLRLALALLGATLIAAPVKVTVVSDDHAAVKNLVSELRSAGAEVTEADRPRDILSATHAKDEVIVLYRKDYSPYEVHDRAALAPIFSNRGIAFVALRGAIAGPSASWARDTFGAGWTPESRRFRALMMLNVRTDAHPLAKDASTFDVTDDTVFNLELNEKIHVLASSFTSKVSANRKNITEVSDKASIYDIQPQAWVFENSSSPFGRFPAGRHRHFGARQLPHLHQAAASPGRPAVEMSTSSAQKPTSPTFVIRSAAPGRGGQGHRCLSDAAWFQGQRRRDRAAHQQAHRGPVGRARSPVGRRDPRISERPPSADRRSMARGRGAGAWQLMIVRLRTRSAY